jgi:hypothetical protein
MDYYDNSSNTIFGESEIEVYVTQPLSKKIDTIFDTIDSAIQGALDKIVGEDGTISYEPKPLNEIATSQPNTGDLDMNGKAISNLKTFNLGDGISGLLSSALSIGLATQMFPNTGLQNLTAEVSMGSKKLTNVSRPDDVEL